MKLNRHNYEEYFILYLDNELSSVDRHEVEAFVEANPDLKEELDMLIHTRMTPDADISFTDKELLMVRDSSSIQLNNYEPWLLSYIDNELEAGEKKDVEQFAAAHPEVQAQLNLLQKTKLQPEPISFPDKKLLYRAEEKARVVSFNWRRLAVAAIFLVAVSTTALVIINKNNDKRLAGTEIKNNEEGKTPVTVPGAIKGETVTPNEEVRLANKDNDENKVAEKENRAPIAVKHNNKTPKEKKESPIQAPDKNDAVIVQNAPVEKPTNNLPKLYKNIDLIDTPQPPIAIEKNNPQTGPLTKSIGNQGNDNVTTNPPKPYNDQEIAAGKTADNPGAHFAGSKKGGLRGFFRKVTRTVAKNANIDSDDDDRLLIAGLAIKLN